MRIRWRGFELPTQVALEQDSATPNFGKFLVEPFERGYGVTIGNSLRRVLISSLEGGAVTSIRVSVTSAQDGQEKTTTASHEFMALPGVYEDVTDLILNIKEMRLKIHTDEPINFKIDRKGQGPVKAGDIQHDERFEIVNPELVLCNLTDDQTAFNIQFSARKGRGYRTAEENAASEAPVGTIPVDSIFSPVRRVRYKVENTRVGQQTDFDKLILEIWTDGTVSPELALVESSTILRKHFNPFVKYFELGKQLETAGVMAAAQPEIGEDAQIRELREKLKLPVSVLDPSVRAENCLAAANIQTLGDLVRHSEGDLLKIKNFGKTSMKEIKKKLADMSMSLGMEIPEEANAPTSS
ncbi:MAG: DNA-directed RNA polymerase subunit alpha [Planctomycetota bacterium]|nr:DNA-directed RNA polymerase subunit alpha [Planctomycetota bacterium]